MDTFPVWPLLVVTVILFIVLYLRGQRGGHYPPMPFRPLPIFGHLLSMKKDLRPYFRRWREQCGDVFSLWMGSKFVVVVSGYDVMKEMFQVRGDDFSDRPLVYFDMTTGLVGKGVTLSSGHVWKEQRTVTSSILRDFGLGRNVLQERVKDEVSHYIDHLTSLEGQAVDINIMTSISVASIMATIVVGERFDYDDPRLTEFYTRVSGMVRNSEQASAVNFFPILQYLPFDLFNFDELRQNVKEMVSKVRGFIQNCQERSSEDNFIGAYQAERERRVSSGQFTTMDDTNLVKIVYELFLAGAETTSATIYWFVLYMLNFPEVQKKIFEEIREHVGLARAPTCEDRPNLIYLNASIKETQRLASVLPFSAPHSCSRDVTFRGYTIPKGSLIFPNLDSIMYDQKIWGDDVLSYRPERFIDQDGQLKTPEEFIPFGVGRRSCLGEAMAKMELFLYLSAMVQRFQFSCVDPDHPPPLTYVFGLTSSPLRYKVIISSRNN
ncbi:Cytochrome P450 2D9 [Bulinus truncatus]|nr:Cytochrome P450 2D9 [Bulinus truncatus]